MRWRDEYLGYVAVIVGFAAVVLWAREVPPAVVAALATAAALLLLALLWNVRRTARVLLVGDREEEPVALMEERLDEAGFEVVRCSGPGVRTCPVELGRPCPVHGRQVAVVVVGRSDGAAVGAPCGRALHLPALVVEEDTEAEPEITTVTDEDVRGRRGYVGWRRGPETVVATLDRLLAG
ncbi:MAG: hypothetical protein ACE14W_08295 [Candidatus Velamenicoccus archaeovorus]